MRSDSALYNCYLAGDTQAYDSLLLRHGDGLTLYLNGYLHNWQDAEDLMIEAFARIMVKKPRIADGCFKAYLYKTARNLASRFHSVRARAQSFSFDELDHEIADQVLTEDKVMDRERNRILYSCLARIGPEYREALWLVYFEDLSYEETASVLGVNKKKVDNLLSRGKQYLKREMEKEGVFL